MKCEYKMIDQQRVTAHYTQQNLLGSITAGIQQLGKTSATVDAGDLAPVDEFHIGGRLATRQFLDQLNIGPDNHVLDAGCGIGGSSRFAASQYGCRVCGIDLTDDYVTTGNQLCRWTGLDDKIKLHQGNALDLPFADASFDKAFMLHVGMNIPDKTGLAGQFSRVLRDGGLLGIYDVMKTGDAPLVFPVPWATSADGSAVDSVDTYKAALENAGFEIIAERSRRDFALEFFAQLKKSAQSRSGPPALGLHLLMGANAPAKISNMIDNISQHNIAPTELIARKI